MEKHKDRYLAAFDAANADLKDGDVLSGLVQSGVAIADLENMWKELAKVAPADIQTDAEAVAEAWSKQADAAAEAASNPIAGIASALGGAFRLAGPLGRVDQYAQDNCGVSGR